MQLTESEFTGGRLCLMSSGLKRSCDPGISSVCGQMHLMSLDTAMKTDVLPTLFSPTNMFKSFDAGNESDLKHLKLLRRIELIHIGAIIAGLCRGVNCEWQIWGDMKVREGFSFAVFRQVVD